MQVDCSLLIPCYNAARYLPRLWECIQNQSVKFSEIIYYNDASSDDTAAIARGYGATVLEGSSNCGPAHARNQLLGAATCEWVHFHDADDLMDSEYLSKCSQYFSDQVDVIFCDADWLFEDTREVELEWRYQQEAIERSPVEEFLRNPVGGINGVFRTQLLRDIGGYNERYRVWEDADLYVRLARAGARFRALPEVLVSALRHSSGVSNDLRICWQSRLECLEDYSDWDDPQLFPAICSELEQTAAALLKARDMKHFLKALRLCQSLGGDPPSTESRVLKFIKPALPAAIPFVLQCILRSFRAIPEASKNP